MKSQESSHRESIVIKGAREQNLKNVDVRIPRGQLTVITGVSGSGKSSLAFDTLYAEGYRKYMDSLSTRIRQMLAQIPKPDVDSIQGLSPVIAIEQRGAGGGSPRSTVATVTEIADYARLLWAIGGKAFNPDNDAPVQRRSLDDCIASVFALGLGTRVQLLAPFMRAKAAVLREELERLKLKGYQRVRMDGEIKRLDDEGLIAAGSDEMTVEIVVDRLLVKEDQRSRLADSLELAFGEGGDQAIVLYEREGQWFELPVSQHFSCAQTGAVFPELTPRHFSPNHVEGACPTCGGVGLVRDFVPSLLVPDESKSVKQGAIKPWRLGSKQMVIKRNAILKQLAEQLPFDATVPWRDLADEVKEALLGGTGERLFSFKLGRGNSKAVAEPFAGVIDDLQQSYRQTTSEGLRARLMTYQVPSTCPTCGGGRLQAYSARVEFRGLRFPQFMQYSIGEALQFAEGALADTPKESPEHEPLAALCERLQFLQQVGLHYLSLQREFNSLSGGESQRVKLATQLGMGLVGVIYVLDEPTIGLHPADNERLIGLLKELAQKGNTVVVVEHDSAMIEQADHVIELGPYAGAHGGELLFSGTVAQCREDEGSLAGRYLAGRVRLMGSEEEAVRGWQPIVINNAREHNLQGVTVSIPSQLLTVVCGVSGSGKSTLINDILATSAAMMLNRAQGVPGLHDSIEGLQQFESVVRVDQSPIGKSPRSNPATYVKLFDLLRALFAKCPLAKVRGYSASRFSFNVKGGRCERCKGDGQIQLDMQFMANAYVQCPSCQGKRYNRETLEIRFRGYSIADVLDMTVAEAVTVFSKQPQLMAKLQTLEEVGLGYIRLGQAANTLSGGEAQRIKLALELSRKPQGKNLYILDEPTTGLNWLDIQKLMDLLFRLRDAGHTIVVIEHNSDVISLADWIIEMGPQGGAAGGQVVFSGTVDSMREDEASLTGRFVSSK